MSERTSSHQRTGTRRGAASDADHDHPAYAPRHPGYAPHQPAQAHHHPAHAPHHPAHAQHHSAQSQHHSAHAQHHPAQPQPPRHAAANTNRYAFTPPGSLRTAVRRDSEGEPRGYTFGHGGRQVRLGPVAFWICVGTLVIMAGWSTVTATYFAFHDDVLARLMARQAAMQSAYEDRISDMRAQVDRVTSRQLLDQEQFEQRLMQVARRQQALEARTSSLGALADPAITGAVRPRTRGLAPHDPAAPIKPSPIDATTTMPAVPVERESLLMNGGVTGALARIDASLNRVETEQTASLDALGATFDSKLRRMRGVFAELGIKASAHAGTEPVGGPFVPYQLASGANAFERQIHRVNLERAQADELAREVAALPLRKPVPGELDTTSAFGVRIDPFVNRPAMHTGIDFRGTVGEPVHATASGTVTVAGWSGGYGRMVEVDHGNGLATRYGHLSAIDVKVGQPIKTGQVVGRLGSTGRSTGPHLHYETRINGEAVDPNRFLRAGIRMGMIQ